MKKQLLLGVFLDERKMIQGVEQLLLKGVLIFDVYTPFMVHGLDNLLKIKRTRLPMITFVAGVFGVLFAISFQYWTSVIDWPVNIGGKPYNSFVAFIPIAFEVTILLAAFISAFAFLVKCSLFPKINKGIILKGITENQFVVAIELKEKEDVSEKIREILLKNGAISAETKEINL